MKNSTFNSSLFAKDLSALIIRNYRVKPPLKDWRTDLPVLKKFTHSCIKASMINGICEPFYSKGKLKAFLLIGKVHLGPKIPMYWGFIETDGSKEADQWVLKKMKEHLSFFTTDTMLELPYYLHHLLKPLYKAGFFIDSVRTVGNSKSASQRLLESGKHLKARAQGLSFQPLKTLAELKHIQIIQKEEFRRNPQYGWFVGSDAWLKQSLESRKADLKNPEACQYVIKKGSQTLGYFGYSLYPGLNGPMAGTEFIFHRSLQGRGLSYVGYKILLEHMIKNDVAFFSGNTSQLPILKAARLMGRVPLFYMIRAGKSHFDLDHFRY